jgi:glucose/arabinose dehydrogenase
MTTSLYAFALVLPAVLAGAARAGTLTFTVNLDAAQETPANFTAGSGSGSVTIDEDTGLLGWDIDYTGLSGPLTAAHFHGPAPLCEPAAVTVAIAGAAPATGNLSGSATITPGQVAQLLNGEWYVNLHTALHPPGEIRGQVVPLPLDDPLPPVVHGGVHVVLEVVASGLVAPNWGTSAPGDPGRLFVTDQPGVLWAIDLATGAKSVFLDTSPLLVPLGIFGPGSFDERGLLGVAFHPAYRANGLLYTFTSEPPRGPADFSTQPPGVDPDCQSVVREWTVPDPGDPGAVVDPGSSRVLLTIDKPQFNHNGGAIGFGPDGMLYIATGDGGSADDQDGQGFFGAPAIGHGCAGNGQDPGTALGKILRIDPQGSDSANGQYGIPADNPFIGAPDFLGEIHALGLRNPFRISFDALTGDLYAADVGQNDVEEVNVIVAGGNYGWNRREGSFFFIANGTGSGYVTDQAQVGPPGLIDPIAQYDHDDGLAVIGGFVYRGVRIPALDGSYVFGEFARTFASDGRLFHLGGGNRVLEFNLIGQESLGLALLGMGQDAQGEVYAMVNASMFPFGDAGMVLRIAPKTGDLDADGVVRMDDFKALLGQWGMGGVAADLDQDGTVNIVDFLLLLMNWG